MNKYISMFVVLLLAVSFLGFSKSNSKATKEYTIDQFLNTTSFSGGSFNYDETKVLFSSDASGVYNIYSFEISDGSLTQLTYSTTHSNFIISTFPRDDRVLYESDASGDEIQHIYLLDKDKSPIDLTPFPGVRSEFAGWSHDENCFYFLSNLRDSRYMDLYEMDLDNLASRMIYKNELGFAIDSVSPDRRYVSLNKIINRNCSEVYLYDLMNKTHQLIIPKEDNVSHTAAGFAPNTPCLYYFTDKDSEFTYLKRYDLETSESQTLAKYDWDVTSFGLSKSGRYHLTTINEDAKSTVNLYDNFFHFSLKFPKFPEGNVNHVVISRSEKLALLSVSDCRSAKNIYLYHLDTAIYQKITSSHSPDINTEDLVAGEVIRFPSYDNLPIPALYYKPHHIKEGQKIPALIWVHGGPGGQSKAEYNYLIQYLVNHGYAVLAINNRGSSGYGKSFFQAADLKHGEADLDDCIQAKKFLKGTGYIDETKIGIIGGSYGGYMTLAALCFRPNEMAVGVDIFGVSNWLRTLKNIPAWWEIEREALYSKIGNPDTNENYLTSISPVFHGKNIVKPLLVLQGSNDPRVLKAESDQIIDAVKDNGVPYQYVLFDDEGHGFVKKKNKKIAAEAILEFLDTHLK